MSRTRVLLAVCTIVAGAGMLACDSAPGTLSAPEARSNALAPATDLATEVRNLLTTGFPRGQRAEFLSKWNEIVSQVRAGPDPEEGANGQGNHQGNSQNNGDHASVAEVRAKLAKLVASIEKKTSKATPPGGETQAHFVARLVLDMSLFVYGGVATPVPVLTPGADIAFKLVLPTVTDTVATPAKQAAVIFPQGAVSQPTVVVITPVDTYYPDNCSGPLVTTRCQYPRFYKFNVFPDVKLNTPAKVQVCHVDAGPNRRALADHNRFRVAHEKPANVSDYSPGSLIFDGVELLRNTAMNVTTCADGGGTTYAPPVSFGARLNPFAVLAMRAVNRVVGAARSLLVPGEAFAIDVGVGGDALLFSTFGIVDPDSKPDLAQSPLPTTRFHATVSTVLAGAAVPLAAWDVTNLGSGTSGAFTSKVIVANDSALASVVSFVTLAGGAALVPGAKYSYAAQSVTAPTAPGTYFVGTKLVYAGTDSTADDDWVSTRVVVTALHNYSLLSGDTSSSAYGGGTGGSSYYRNCPAGSVGVGLSGTAGSYYGWQSIFRVQLQCAHLQGDGSLGESFTTPAAGIYPGGTAFNGTCSSGQVLVGGRGLAVGNEPPLVASLTGSCARIATVAAAGSPESSIGPFSGIGSTSYSAPFSSPCRLGYAVTGIQGGAGDILDRIGFLCTRVIDAPPATIY